MSDIDPASGEMSLAATHAGSEFVGTRSMDWRLSAWLSPSFPVGAFAYSHGLELAADRGWIAGRQDLANWLRDLLELGSLQLDLALLAEAARAASRADWQALAAINELALAMQPSAERYLETSTQGTAFLTMMLAAWRAPKLAEVRVALANDVAYPVAVGGAVACHNIALHGALSAYALAFLSNLLSASIRLSLIGQTDAQELLVELLPSAGAAADAALITPLDALGTATLRSDLASMAHETQYSRLFRS